MKLRLLGFFTAGLFATAASAGSPPAAPGSPCGAGPNSPVSLREGPNEIFADEHTGPVSLQNPVVGGYVVLVDQATPQASDPTYWSDVAVFNDGHPPPPGECDFHVTFISESPNAAGQETGITDQDLAAAGVTTADVINGNTLYFLENGGSDLNLYTAGQNVYELYSDPPETVTPTRPGTWGRIKMLYR